MPNWTKDCEMQVYLESLFESGELGETDKPKDVFERYAQFREYSIDVFRKNFNSTKRAFVNGQKTPRVTPVQDKNRQSKKKVRSYSSTIFTLLAHE